MSFSQHNASFVASKTARDLIVMGPQSSRRFNKSSSRQEPLSRKPSASAGRHPQSKEKSSSFTNSSFLNSSQLDNQRSNSQNAHYGQETSLSNYIAQAFDRERRATTALVVNVKKGEQDTHQDITRTEEYRVREMKLLLRIAALEKETYRLQEQLQKIKTTKMQQHGELDKNVAKLQRDKDILVQQLTQLKECLEAQKMENAQLKKYVSSHTSATKRSDSKNSRTNTTMSINSSSGYKHYKIGKEYVPSFMVALKLIT